MSVLTFVISLALFIPNISQNSFKNIEMYSENIIVMERGTQEIVYENNAYEKVHPASLTKILTTITAIELLDQTSLEENYRLEAEIFDDLNPIATTAGFQKHETVKIKDLIYGTMLPSGADASRAISQYLTGSPEGLTKNMNDIAQEIGMKDSYFINTSGLDEEHQLSTAYDLAILTDYALNNPTFRDVFESRTYQTQATDFNTEGYIFQNLMLRLSDAMPKKYIQGAKSGYTEKAQRSLASYARINGKEYIIVSLKNNKKHKEKGQHVLNDHYRIYHHLAENLHELHFFNQNDIVGELNLPYKSRYDFKLPHEVNLLLPNEIDRSDIEIEIDKNNFQSLPIPTNSHMGTLKLKYHQNILYKYDFYNEKEIKASPFILVVEFLKNLSIIIVISSVIIILSLYLIRDVKRYKQRNKRKR